jgi:hypothetical protein
MQPAPPLGETSGDRKRGIPALRLHAPKSPLGLLPVSALLTVLLGVACGGGDDDSKSDPGSDHPDPAPTLYSLVDAINRGEIQTFHNGLSADRQASVSVAEVQGALDTVEALLGYVPELEITELGEKRINGDSAEVDTTLTVQLRGGGIPVKEVAILKWEDGGWHLGDHFLDQALAVLGLAGGAPSPSTSPSPAR